jgi:hypothetical protein
VSERSLLDPLAVQTVNVGVRSIEGNGIILIEYRGPPDAGNVGSVRTTDTAADASGESQTVHAGPKRPGKT